MTGLKTTLDTGREGPNIAVIGELDGLPVLATHMKIRKMVTPMLVVTMLKLEAYLQFLWGYQTGKILNNLCGKITFMAVPAEEFVEIEWRNKLRENGYIEFLAGKQEMIKDGHFDDIDMAIMTHTTPRNLKFSYGGTNNGLVAKFIEFIGKASHAGNSPEKGINALNAANIAMNAINSQRETFKDEDHIRVHPIITRVAM